MWILDYVMIRKNIILTDRDIATAYVRRYNQILTSCDQIGRRADTVKNKLLMRYLEDVVFDVAK